MVKVWYMDNIQSNPHLEHHLNPPKYISLKELNQTSGVIFYKLNLETYRSDGVLDEIRKTRGYSYEDEITCTKEIPAEKLKIFFTEHLHTDEEIRLILEGSGYFDVRDKNDEWIRIHVHPGEMIIIPSGIYHRFTLDTNMYVKAKRYFIGEPVWVPHNRPEADPMECRKEYLKTLESGEFNSEI